MTAQRVEKRKKQIASCTVSVNWQHTEEESPAFKRLMMLLLRDRSEKSGVEKKDKLT